MKKILLALVSIITFTTPITGHCEIFRYVKTISGDTIVVLFEGDEIIIRLYGIDAPDIGSINHEKSRKFLEEIMKAKNSYIVGRSTIKSFFDEYGRHVAVIDKDGVCINEKMIESGMAFVHPEECKFDICTRWKDIETIAQAKQTSISFIKEEMPWVAREQKSYLVGKYEGYYEDIYFVRKKEKVTLKSGKVVYSILAKAYDTEIPKDRYYYIPAPPTPRITNYNFNFLN